MEGLKMNILKTSEIKANPEILRNFPRLAGWYKFWAKRKVVELWLNDFPELLEKLTKKEFFGETYYYVYVGITRNESVENRLHWHINQQNTYQHIIVGTLSTLRVSVAALMYLQGRAPYSNKATEEVMGDMVVEFEPFFEIRDAAGVVKAEEIERNEMANNVLILNIKGNHSKECAEFKKFLKQARQRQNHSWNVSTARDYAGSWGHFIPEED